MRWLVPGAAAGWITDASVTVTTSTGQPAARLYVLHNWSWDEATATPPVKVTDLLDGGSHPPGEPIGLHAWDVRILGSDEPPEV